MPDAPAASVSVDRVAQTFNFEWAMNPDNGANMDTYWWWVRDVRLDPDEVICDDGSGGTYRVPFTTDGEHQVTFGTPVEVRETYVDVAAPAAAASAATARVGQRVAARGLPKPSKPSPSSTPSAASRPRPEEEGHVPLDITALRSRLQLTDTELPDDATEEQINAVLAAESDEPEVETRQVSTDVTETVVQPAEREQELAAAAFLGALGLPSTATDQQVRDRVAELEANAAAGAAARNEQIKEQRDALVTAAVKDGRIPPSARAAWRDAIDVRPEAESAALAALAPGRIPVDERGSDAAAAAGTQIQSTGWFPQLVKEA